jgi:hypothetical protein
MGLVARVARHWPADIVVRGLAATLKVLTFPFFVNTLSTSPPPGITSPAVLRFYEHWQEPLLRTLGDWFPWVVFAAIVVIGASSPRVGIALTVLLLYYAGYPALQFSLRHYFHLEFIVWWALVFLVAWIGRWLLALLRDSTLPVLTARNTAITAAALAAIAIGPLILLRLYQQPHVTSLIHGYLNAQRSSLPVSLTRSGDRTLVAPDGLWIGHRAGDPFDVRYLAAEFSADRCSAATVAVTAKYYSVDAANDFSYEKQIVISSSGPTEWFVPVYYDGELSHFSGFELPASLDGCLKAVSRIDEPGQLPVLVDLDLAPGWEHTSLFQRVAMWEPAR